MWGRYGEPPTKIEMHENPYPYESSCRLDHTPSTPKYNRQYRDFRDSLNGRRDVTVWADDEQIAQIAQACSRIRIANADAVHGSKT